MPLNVPKGTSSTPTLLLVTGRKCCETLGSCKQGSTLTSQKKGRGPILLESKNCIHRNRVEKQARIRLKRWHPPIAKIGFSSFPCKSHRVDFLKSFPNEHNRFPPSPIFRNFFALVSGSCGKLWREVCSFPRRLANW